MNREAALDELPESYAVALRLRDAGHDNTGIATGTGTGTATATATATASMSVDAAAAADLLRREREAHLFLCPKRHHEPPHGRAEWPDYIPGGA